MPRASKIVLGASKFAKKIVRAPKFSKINALGRILAALCVPQAQLSCFWEPLGRSQATFPAIWGACRALRTHFGAPFRRHSCTVPCMHNPQQKSSTPSEPPHSQEFPHYGAAVSRQRLQSAGRSPRGAEVLDTSALMSVNGEVYLSPPSPPSSPRPPKYLPLQPFTTRYNHLRPYQDDGGHFCRSWTLLGRSWRALGRSWDALGTLLNALGRLLDASWTLLGKVLKGITLLRLNLGAKIHPSWLQNP